MVNPKSGQRLVLLRAARSQVEAEPHAMRAQVQVLQQQEKVHTKGVGSRAHDLVYDMQTKHQPEIDRIQQIANETCQNSRQFLRDALQKNQVLVQNSNGNIIYLTNKETNKEKCVQQTNGYRNKSTHCVQDQLFSRTNDLKNERSK